MPTGGKRAAEGLSGSAGPDTKGAKTTAQQLLTPEGVDVSEALVEIILLCCNLDLRHRLVEAATYITIEALPNHPQVIRIGGTKKTI